VNIIPSTFFIVTNNVSNLGYQGNSFKPGETIEINNEDIKNFDPKWLIPIKKEPELIKTLELPKDGIVKVETPKRGRKKVTE